MSSWGKMNQNKKRGSEFERQVLKTLQAKGYYATRSAGSHQIVDIMALGLPEPFGGLVPRVLFIQCKRGGAISIDEWNQLFSTAARYRARPLVVEAGKRSKGPVFSEILSPKILGKDERGHRRVTSGGESEIFVP